MRGAVLSTPAPLGTDGLEPPMPSHPTPERWLPVVGFGDYEVSDLGRVRRSVQRGPFKPGSLLRPHISRIGYARIKFFRGGKEHSPGLHVVVAEAFIGMRPTPKHEVNHRNGVKLDNRAVNLEWVTRRENVLHATTTGLRREFAGRKLKREQVAVIRASHEGIAALAAQFGVSESQVQRIRAGTAWLERQRGGAG